MLGVRLLDALRQGDVVALQGDRPRADGRTVEAPFLGRTLGFPVGPAALARAAGVPLVPVFVFREGRLRSRVSIRAPIEVAETRDRDADVADATRRLAAEIERAVRAAPHQWFCFAPLWRG
jgi:KDO2-lipid IV(A) lauroyltransferase